MKPKSLFRIILVFLLALIAFQLEAQLTITGEIRPRFEFRDGYKRLPDSTTTPAYLVTQRSRLGFAYKTDKLNTKITIQDVRTWGDELLKSDVPSVAIYEAWAEFPVSDSLFL
ncbi:MAG: hypothetical protein NTW49_03895, partial [Bacteroidia bacterium]|nr:hypothetical protein [Bacteroidia bacterium]